MNQHVLRGVLKTIQKDLQEVHESNCLGCAHLAAARASVLANSLLHIMEEEQLPPHILRIVPLDENELEGA
jgi:hypothetical protein